MEWIVLVVFGVAAVIGLWALAGLFSAAAGAGGIRKLLREWRKAVSGR